MNLLQVDHHLLIFHQKTGKVYDITNSPINNIRNIIFDNNRVIILTSTKLYYLYFNLILNIFEVFDMTSDIILKVSINDIKFISGEDTLHHNKEVLRCGFHIITQNNEIFHAVMYDHIFGWLSREHYAYTGNEGVNILMAASRNFGIIYKSEDKYRAGYMGDNGITASFTINELPKQFITLPILYKLSRVTNNQQITCDVKETIDHTIITIIDKHERILLNKSQEVIYVNAKQYVSTHIGYSYYHTENLLQYTNRRLNVTWTPGDHHLFGKYVDKYVTTVLLCYKKCNYIKYLPRQVLFYIFQFIL